MAQTYYDILGVAENATNAEIEAAFRAKAREVHPDKIAPGNPYLRKVAAEAFKDLSEAKSVLLNRFEREKYDAGLTYMRGSPASSTHPSPQPQASPPPNRASQPPQQAAPSPTPAPKPTQKYSFWKPLNTIFGAVVLVAGWFGVLLLLGGIASSANAGYLGLALLLTSFALLSWRHGMRPSTDPKILGGSVFLFLFAAMSLAAWIESPSIPPNPRTIPTTQAPAQVASKLPVVAVPPKTVNANTTGGSAIRPQPVGNPSTTEASHPPESHSMTEKDSISDAINGNSENNEGSPEGMSASSGKSQKPAEMDPSNVTRTWKNLRDGQTYRTRRTGQMLYLESVDHYPARSSDIISCEFHRAVTIGLSWTGICWERNRKDQSANKSDATITKFSEARIEMGTGNIPGFAMIPAESVPNTTSRSSISVESQTPSSPHPGTVPLTEKSGTLEFGTASTIDVSSLRDRKSVV